MCGIAGVIDLKGREQPDEAMLLRMADALWHRGPDDDGFLLAPEVGAANRRLSIIGLGDGRQPIFNEDRSIAVVFNGELLITRAEARTRSEGTCVPYVDRYRDPRASLRGTRRGFVRRV